jgi:hypothetical protein
MAQSNYKNDFVVWYLYSKSLSMLGKGNSKSLAQAKRLAIDSRQKALVYVEECEFHKQKGQKSDAFQCAKNGLVQFPGNPDLAQIASEFAGSFGEKPEVYLKTGAELTQQSSKYAIDFLPISYTSLQKLMLGDKKG